MFDADLKEEINKYSAFTDYLSEDAVIGTRVGLVRKLIKHGSTPSEAQLPRASTIQCLLDASNDTSLNSDLRKAITVALGTIADLQAQIRGIRIEQTQKYVVNSTDVV